MCPCPPHNSEFTYALLITGGVLLSIGVMREFWPSLSTGSRVGAVAVLMALCGVLLGCLAVASRDASEGRSTMSAMASNSTLNVAPTSVPRLVDLGADKCIPCKMMAPILSELKKEYEGRLQVDFIDVWKNPQASAAFLVKTIPTQVFFDGSGRELYRHEGFMSKGDILARWKKLGVDLSVRPTTRPSTSIPADGLHAKETPTAKPVLQFRSEQAPSRERDEAKVIVYYFHRTMRCHSCLTIERLSQQTIDELFKAELAKGLLEYRAVNIEQPGNEHFEEDHDLMVQSLVLVRMENGRATAWKNLKKVWDLFDDQGAFMKYVQNEVLQFLHEAA